MSTFTAPRTIQITPRHPPGSIRLATTTDVPLGDLMPDFLGLVEQPDSDSCAISPRGADPYPDEHALASSASPTARCSASTDDQPRRRRLRRLPTAR
jgi:hypothetical protein